MLAATIVEVTPHALKRFRTRFNAHDMPHTKALREITTIVLASRRPSKHTCKRLQQVWQGSTNVARAAKRGQLWWNADRKCVVVGGFLRPKLFLCRTIIVPDFNGGNMSKLRALVRTAQPLFSYHNRSHDGEVTRRLLTVYRISSEHLNLFGSQYPFLRVEGFDIKNAVPMTAADVSDVLGDVLQRLGELASLLTNETPNSSFEGQTLPLVGGGAAATVAVDQSQDADGNNKERASG